MKWKYVNTVISAHLIVTPISTPKTNPYKFMPKMDMDWI